MSYASKAVAWAIQIAKDNSIGYIWGGWGPLGWDCGHLVIDAYQKAGLGVKSAGASYTGNMRSAFLGCGFKDVTAGVNLSTGSGLILGDVLLNQARHAALYIGSGQIVQASSDYDGRDGDSSGREIATRSYYNYPWDCILRPPAAPTASTSEQQPPHAKTNSDTYTVKAGDTLSGIASRLGLSWAQMASWNDLKDPYTIYPGQVLVIHAPAQENAAQATTSATDPKTYTVRSGDTLWQIAASQLGAGARWRKIADANRISFPWIIRAGQLLIIPADGR